MELQRDQLKIQHIYMVVGTAGQQIRDYFGDGSRWGVRINYLQNDRVDLGLAYSVSLGEQVIHEPFILMLSDEYYFDTNHARLSEITLQQDELGYCGLMQSQDWDRIRRNYTVTMEEDRITRLLEKPRERIGDLLGTGTFLLSPRIFAHLKRALSDPAARPDFIGLVDQAVRTGETLRPLMLTGHYLNINEVDSLNWANYLGRSRQLPTASLSVIVQSLGVEEGLSRVVTEFNDLPRVSEVLVVVPDGKAQPAWSQPLTKVRWLEAPPGRTEYGSLIAYGLDAARGDILTVVEGAYSFLPRDLSKLLAYMADADLVLGTRTTRQLIQQGSRMRGIVRLAHVFLASLIEILWLGHHIRLTDAGCTYRAIWRHSYVDIRDHLHSTGSEYVLEMDIETLRARKRLIEVPVSFLRINEDLAERYQHTSVFFRMLWTIIRKRLDRG